MTRSRLTRTTAPVFLLAIAAAALAQSLNQSPPPQQILVDGRCRVFSQKTLRWRSNHDVCTLEGMGVHASSHIAAKEVNGKMQHTRVYVEEQTYLLQNTHAEPVVFLVQQKVKQGWHVDSDPQPDEMNGDVAVFPVHADPGQIVRLHVGVALEIR